MNLAAFYNDYQDQQVSSFIDTTIVLLNVGKSATYGLEGEFKFQATEAFYMQLGIAYLKAEFTKFGVEGVDLIGNELEQSPKLSFNGLVSYQWQVMDGVVRAQADYFYKGDHYMDIFNSESSRQNSYGLWGAKVSYEINDFSFSFWGKNLSDEEYFTNFFGSRFLGAEQFSTGAPKTYGIGFSYNYE